MNDMTLDLTPEEQILRDKCILVAQQNDRFRNTWGADVTIRGTIVFTRAVAELGIGWRAAIMRTVQNFTDFNEDNDPYFDHTFAAFEVTVGAKTERFLFKIDLYALDLLHASEEPENLAITHRVMTIMNPSDY